MADDGLVTAILIAPGELKNKGLYLPDDVAPAAAQLFLGKPVFLDHGVSPDPNSRPDNRRISEISEVWTEGGAVYGKFAVANESIRGILRGLKDMGLGRHVGGDSISVGDTASSARSWAWPAWTWC